MCVFRLTIKRYRFPEQVIYRASLAV